MFEKLAFPVRLIEIPHPVLEGTKIKDRMAIVRDDNNEILNIVSKKYPLVTHLQVMEAMEAAIQRLNLPVKSRIEHLAYRGGKARVVWTLDKSIEIPGQIKDDLDLRIVCRNSYDYTSDVALELGTLRRICTNGATIGQLFKRSSKRHVPSINVDKLVDEISGVLEATEFVQAQFSKWATMEYPKNRLAQWLEKTPAVPKKAREQILEYYGIQPDRVSNGGEAAFNGWEAYNAITWYATHKVSSRREGGELGAEERILDLSKLFSREELEAKAFTVRN